MQTTINEGSELIENEMSDIDDENEPFLGDKIFENYTIPDFDPYNTEEAMINEDFL